MKRILITGANSYIGTSFEKYIIDNFPDDYIVDTIDMIDGTWREKSFAGYDTVFHVAGIAHQKETKKNAHIYYEINRDLAVETAQKAKLDGVGQFVFLSSMSIYGMDRGIITQETLPKPKSNYGRSKYEAEQEIIMLSDETFFVCILRPPMVYGKGCKGNFVKIKKIVERFSFFPRIQNRRSMIYIDNLSSFVKWCVDSNAYGIYFPQNEEYVATTEIVQGISEVLNKKIYLDYVTGYIIMLLCPLHPVLRKAFGSLIYKIDTPTNYCVENKKNSIRKSV